MITERMKRIQPSALDTIDYDRDLLEKQLELDKVTIFLKADMSSPEPQDYIRTITRTENKLGKFERLRKELEAIALEYNRDVDELLLEFSEAGCSKRALIQRLQDQKEEQEELQKLERQEREKERKQREEEERLER